MLELTQVMREACGSKLLAITCGEESSILATDSNVSLRVCLRYNVFRKIMSS